MQVTTCDTERWRQVIRSSACVQLLLTVRDPEDACGHHDRDAPLIIKLRCGGLVFVEPGPAAVQESGVANGAAFDE